jgi:hypothetical protein
MVDEPEHTRDILRFADIVVRQRNVAYTRRDGAYRAERWRFADASYD